MLLGSQWYILFNVLAGASAMPQDLREAADDLRAQALGALAARSTCPPCSRTS